jgi:hypothetical protein
MTASLCRSPLGTTVVPAKCDPNEIAVVAFRWQAAFPCVSELVSPAVHPCCCASNGITILLTALAISKCNGNQIGFAVFHCRIIVPTYDDDPPRTTIVSYDGEPSSLAVAIYDGTPNSIADIPYGGDSSGVAIVPLDDYPTGIDIVPAPTSFCLSPLPRRQILP